MQKRLTVKPHLSLEAVENHYRKAKDPVARSRWQIVWLLAQSKTTKQIVEYTGYGLTWIPTFAHRSNEGGPQALGDRRHGNSGGEVVNDEQCGGGTLNLPTGKPHATWANSG
jgi:hypothetical protein